MPYSVPHDNVWIRSDIKLKFDEFRTNKNLTWDEFFEKIDLNLHKLV